MKVRPTLRRTAMKPSPAYAGRVNPPQVIPIYFNFFENYPCASGHDGHHSPPHLDAGWSSPVARQAHNLKVLGSNPSPAPISVKKSPRTQIRGLFRFRKSDT